MEDASRNGLAYQEKTFNSHEQPGNFVRKSSMKDIAEKFEIVRKKASQPVLGL